MSRLELQREQSPQNEGLAKLYPNVKGCGYPPDLDCDAFFEEFGKVWYLYYMTSTQVNIRVEGRLLEFSPVFKIQMCLRGNG